MAAQIPDRDRTSGSGLRIFFISEEDRDSSVSVSMRSMDTFFFNRIGSKPIFFLRVTIF
ncbi:MAG: hypothetical protein WC379_05890 [Methanoregula sp.]